MEVEEIQNERLHRIQLHFLEEAVSRICQTFLNMLVISFASLKLFLIQMENRRIKQRQRAPDAIVAARGGLFDELRVGKHNHAAEVVRGFPTFDKLGGADDAAAALLNSEVLGIELDSGRAFQAQEMRQI